MWFGLARSEGFPTQYEASATSVTVDVLDAGLITAALILAISFSVSYLTTNKNTNLILFTRISLNLLIGAFLLINNFGQDWEVGHVNTLTPYRAGTGEEINALISVKIGLRSVNVTLKNITELDGVLAHEIINYNERFEWTWDQGRFGFGPYAGHLQQQFRAAQYRGLPLPILWIVDYFVIDGEGQRYGRFYRTAGWYSHIIMWSAFACWLLANILFRSVIHYGAYVLGLCGALQLFANLIFTVVSNPFPLVIPFDDAVLVTKYGFHFWCNFVMGLFCLLLSAAILFMDYQYDELLYSFFGVNPLNSYDEVVYLTKEERLQLRPKKSSNDIPLVTLETGNKQEEDDEDVDYVPVYLKRKTEHESDMQPTKRAVIHTIARSRTYSHSLVDGNYGTRKRNSNTQTDCTIWRHTFFDHEIQFDSKSSNFSEESRKTYGMALKYINRFHHLMNRKLRDDFELSDDSENNEGPFIFPNVPDYSSLFSLILKKPKSPRCCHQTKYGNSLPDRRAKEHPRLTSQPLPTVEKNAKLTMVNEVFQNEVNSFKYINVGENQCVQKTYSKAYDCQITPVVSPREHLSKWSELSSTCPKEKSEKVINGADLMYSKNEQPNNLDLLKAHLLEDLWNNYLKLDKPKYFKQKKLEKTCFSIVNIQPYISLIDYAQKKIERNVNLDTLTGIKNEEKIYLQNQESNILSPKIVMNSRPNAPIKVKNMFDKISKSQEKIVSRKIFESNTFNINDESDADSIIFDDVEFEKMSQKSHCVEGTEILLFNKTEEKSDLSNNGKSNPLKLNGKDMTKLNEKMLSAIGLFTERGDIRPGVIDILEEHKKLKSNDTRNKQFRSKRQWDIQIHLKPKKEPQSSLPSVSSDKSFISLSSDIRLQVKNVKSQFHEID